MEAVLEHVRTHATIYIVAAVCLLPICIFFWRYVSALLRYSIEIAVYLTAFHVALCGVVRLARWFKGASTMRALSDGTPEPPPPWYVPLQTFWDRSAYFPQWVFYFELCVIAAIIFLVFRFRPMKVQRPKPKKGPVRKPASGVYAPVTKKGSGR